MEVIDQVRHAANIIEIASQYTTLRRSGRRYVGLCPFHSEKTPSFTLDEEKQLFHCFGCGAGGDVFTLVMEKENLSFPEALRYLAQKYNISLPEKKRFSPQVQKLKEKINTITGDALAHFRKNLFNTNEGKKTLAYLHKRNITDETIQKLKIGYAMNSWDALISFFKRKNVSASLLEKAGLSIFNQKKNSYYDRFRGRVIFPIFNESGKAVAFGGRSLFDAEPKYLNSPDTPIYMKGKILYGLNFCLDAIKEKGEIVLVEGYTDFVALLQAGIPNLAASLGTSLTPDQVSLAKRFAKKMILCFDGDLAGTKATSRAVSIGFEKGLQTSVMKIPKGLDPDSFLTKHGTDSFKELMQSSVPGLKFLIEEQLQEFKPHVPEEKAKIVKNITTEIAKISDPVVFNEYLRQTSEHLGVDEGVLRSIIRQKSAESTEQENVFLLPAEKILLQMLFENSGNAAFILKSLNDQDLTGLRSESIFQMIKTVFKKNKRFPEMHELKNDTDPPLYSALSKLRLEKGGAPTKEDALDSIESLKKRSLERQFKALHKQIAQLQRKGENEKIPDLLNQISKITSQLSALSQRNT